MLILVARRPQAGKSPFVPAFPAVLRTLDDDAVQPVFAEAAASGVGQVGVKEISGIVGQDDRVAIDAKGRAQPFLKPVPAAIFRVVHPIQDSAGDKLVGILRVNGNAGLTGADEAALVDPDVGDLCGKLCRGRARFALATEAQNQEE